MNTRINTFGLAGLCLLAWPVSTPAAPSHRCNPAIVNREDCSIHIDREQPTSPLPVKMRPGNHAWIVTEKRPLEDIKSVVTSTEQPRPDVLAALLTSLSKSLPAVQFATHVSTDAQQQAGPRFLPSPRAGQCARQDALSQQVLYAEKAWADQVDRIGQRQSAVDKALTAQKDRLVALSNDLKKLQSFVPDRPWKDEPDRGPSCFVNMVRGLANRIEGKSTPTGAVCKGFDATQWDPGQRLQPVSSGELDLIADDLTALRRSYAGDLQGFKRQVEGLSSGRNDPLNQCPVFESLQFLTQSLAALAPAQIADLVSGQSQLTTRFNTTQQAETALGPLARTLQQRADFIARNPDAAIADEQSYGTPLDERGIQSKTVKLSAQQPLGGDSTDLASVNVSWVDSHWEISTGVLVSNLLSRSFQNAPIIQNGQPVVDSGGKTLTVVSQTTSKPVVVPLIFVHYRLPLDTDCGAHRCAFFLSGGIGVSTQSGASADFAVGPTFAYGNFMLTPALHFTRDIRLSNGVKVGQELGPQPPSLPTEKYWVHKVGLALTYSLPIT
jgi:hypothetical protein